MAKDTMNITTRTATSTACLLLALLVSVPALAQEPAPAEPAPEGAEATDAAEDSGDAATPDDETGDAAGDEASADAGDADAAPESGGEAEGDDPTAAEPAPAPAGDITQNPDPLSGELERYWSTDRDLASIENKLYRREGRFGIGVNVGLMSSEPFWWYLPVGLRTTYNFTDQLGVEVGGQYLLANKTDLHNFFDGRGVETFDSDTDLEDRMVWRANATFVWSPLYGKWSFLNNKLTHFEFNLAVGAGVVGVNRPNAARTEASSAIEPELVFGPGAHFFLTDNWILRADGRFYVYRGAETESASSYFERLQMPIEFLVGGTYQF